MNPSVERASACAADHDDPATLVVRAGRIVRADARFAALAGVPGANAFAGRPLARVLAVGDLAPDEIARHGPFLTTLRPGEGGSRIVEICGVEPLGGGAFALRVCAPRAAGETVGAGVATDLSRRSAEIGMLTRLAAAAATAAGPVDFLARSAAELRRYFEHTALEVYVLAHAGAEAEVLYRCGDAVGPTHAPRVGDRVPLDGLLAEVVASRSSQVRGMATGAARAVQLGVPLLVGGRVVGVLRARFAPGRALDPGAVPLLETFAAHVAAAIESSRLFRDLRARVDELRESTVEVARAQHELLNAARLAAVGELAATVAHEVRNPLGVISNAVASLKRLVEPTGEAALLCAALTEESQRLNRLMASLLDFSRPVAPVVRPEDTGRLLDDAAEAALAEDGDAAGRVVIERSVAPAMPPVPLDAGLIHRLLVNLLRNAVQAMPGGGRVRLRAALSPDKISAWIDVEDDGPGIAPELQSRIFEPFFTTHARGTGLGLAIVRRIAEAHGGQVKLTSARGHGTRFRVELPLVSASSPTPPGSSS